jgi:hypothetical protein
MCVSLLLLRSDYFTVSLTNQRSFHIIPLEYKKFRIKLANLIISVVETFIDVFSIFSAADLRVPLLFNDSQNQIRKTSLQTEIDDLILRACKILLSAPANGIGELSLNLPFSSASVAMLENIVGKIMNGSIFTSIEKSMNQDFLSIVILRYQNIDYLFALINKIVNTKPFSDIQLKNLISFCCKSCLGNVDIQRVTVKPVSRLLASVCKMNHNLCGATLHDIQSQFSIVKDVALSIFRSLPVEKWIPTHADVLEMENMLKDPLESPKSVLARYLIGEVSWNRCAVISLESRKHLALAIVNTYLDYEGRRKNLQRTSFSRAIYVCCRDDPENLVHPFW